MRKQIPLPTLSTSVLDASESSTQRSIANRVAVPRLLWQMLLGYILLLFLLVPLGIYNRELYQHEWERIEYKEGLLDSMADLRVAEAKIRGPEQVRIWALNQGMIPNAEVSNVLYTPYGYHATPVIMPSPPEIEVMNTWR